MVRNALKSFFGILVILIFAAGVFAQEKTEAKPAAKQDAQGEKKFQPTETDSEANRPADNYLERFHALDVCEKLQTENLERIYTLNVITQNFKSQHADWDTDYKACYNKYKESCDLYFKRDIIYARVSFEDNKRQIDMLFEKIAKAYQKDCEDLLMKCSDLILDLTLGVDKSGSSGRDEANNISRSSPEMNRAIFNNKMRVRIAYGEIMDAKRSVDSHVPHVAIFHYRIAKSYAIRILEELDGENSKGKYDIHKADNLNRVLSKQGKSSAPAKTEEKKEEPKKSGN